MAFSCCPTKDFLSSRCKAKLSPQIPGDPGNLRGWDGHSIPWEFCSRSAARRRLPLLKNPSCGERKETKTPLLFQEFFMGYRLEVAPGYGLYGKGSFGGDFEGSWWCWGAGHGSREFLHEWESPKIPQNVQLTFQSARTSRARSRRPPKVLPRMIQMGICDSSGLEISNVIWRRENAADSGQESREC